MNAIALLAGLLALNAWATLRLLRADGHFRRRGMFVAVSWLAPVAGPLMALGELRVHERATRFHAAPEREQSGPPPQALHAAGVDDFALATHLQDVNGFPIPDWTAVDEWRSRIADERERSRAGCTSRRAWFEHLRTALGPRFWLHETEDAIVLSSLEPAVAAATARYVSITRSKISSLLGTLARFTPGEKSVLLVLDDEDAYYRYVSIYYPAEGEFAFSSGMFIDAGCPHFVVRRADLVTIEPVIAHELTHSALAHLRLPTWLDEGIAVNTERQIAGARRREDDARQMHARHVKFWGEPEIQQFWSGESFRRADDGNALSYDLARIIVEQAGRNWPRFAGFVGNARRADAGAASAREHLDIDLGAYVCLLLDKAPSRDWSPEAQQPA
jgi:hypothetical protein